MSSQNNKTLKRKAYELQGNYRVFSLYENAIIGGNSPCKSPANKTIYFAGDNCDEMVNKLTLDAELLSDNSDKTRKAISNKKKGIVKIPRPPNAFIIYRREMKAKHKFCKIPEADISKELGKMWQNEPEEVKEMYYRLAEHAKKKHQEKYSGYKYKPERAKKKGNKKDDESSNHTEPPPNSDLSSNPNLNPELTYHDIHLANYAYYVN